MNAELTKKTKDVTLKGGSVATILVLVFQNFVTRTEFKDYREAVEMREMQRTAQISALQVKDASLEIGQQFLMRPFQKVYE